MKKIAEISNEFSQKEKISKCVLAELTATGL